MVLVDTSVWVDHFRRACPVLAKLLEDGDVAIHPWVVGELACGNLKNRTEILELLRALPEVPRADDDEIIHLLASSQVGGHVLWTKDRRLRTAAQALGIDFGQPPTPSER